MGTEIDANCGFAGYAKAAAIYQSPFHLRSRYSSVVFSFPTSVKN